MLFVFLGSFGLLSLLLSNTYSFIANILNQPKFSIGFFFHETRTKVPSAPGFVYVCAIEWLVRSNFTLLSGLNIDFDELFRHR